MKTERWKDVLNEFESIDKNRARSANKYQDESRVVQHQPGMTSRGERRSHGVFDGAIVKARGSFVCSGAVSAG